MMIDGDLDDVVECIRFLNHEDWEKNGNAKRQTNVKKMPKDIKVANLPAIPPSPLPSSFPPSPPPPSFPPSHPPHPSHNKTPSRL